MLIYADDDDNNNNSTLASRTKLGGAFFSVLCTREIEYFVYHNLGDSISNIYMVNDDNEFLFSLNGIRSPVMGKQNLNAELLGLLLTRNFYLVLESNSTSAIYRTQVTSEFPLYSYISGSQETPHVSTFSKGLAVFEVNNDGDSLYYRFFHDLSIDSSISVYRGNFGVDGELLFSLPNIEGFISLSENLKDSLISQELYVRIEDDNESIRGQILLFSLENCYFDINRDDDDSSYSGYYISSRYFSPADDSSFLRISFVSILFIALLLL